MARPTVPAVVLAYPVLCVLVLAVGGKPYYTMPLLVPLVVAGAAPTWRWASGYRG